MYWHLRKIITPRGFYIHLKSDLSEIYYNGLRVDEYPICLLATPAVNVPHSLYSAKVGFRLTIPCRFTSPLRVTSIKWLRIRNGLTTTLNIEASGRYDGGTVTSPSLVIRNVTAEDAALYVCVAHSSAGQGRSGKSVLQVMGSKLLHAM